MICPCPQPPTYPHFSPLCPQHGKITPPGDYDAHQAALVLSTCEACGRDYYMRPGLCADCRG